MLKQARSTQRELGGVRWNEIGVLGFMLTCYEAWGATGDCSGTEAPAERIAKETMGTIG